MGGGGGVVGVEGDMRRNVNPPVWSRRVYEARASQTVGQRLSQTNLLSIFTTHKVNNRGIRLGCF